jgi:hypothetical protein
MMNAEDDGGFAQSRGEATPMRHQCDINATPKRMMKAEG